MRLNDQQKNSERFLISTSTDTSYAPKQLAQHLPRHPKKFVLIASMSVQIANQGPFSIGTNSSKAVIVQTTRPMAIEWTSLGIGGNTLSLEYSVNISITKGE